MGLIRVLSAYQCYPCQSVFSAFISVICDPPVDITELLS